MITEVVPRKTTAIIETAGKEFDKLYECIQSLEKLGFKVDVDVEEVDFYDSIINSTQ